MNDEGLYEMAREMTKRSNKKHDLAEAIKNFIEEDAPDLGSSLCADLLNTAIHEIDFYEIAECWIKDFKEEEEEDNE